MSIRFIFIICAVAITAAIGVPGYYYPKVWWAMVIFGPLILMGIYDILQKSHSIKHNFPVIGRMRYLLEKFRPEIMQYFVETDTEGKPFSRLRRNLIYQRSKKAIDTRPFGTQHDVYAEGYEWMEHSIYAADENKIGHSPRRTIGGKDCSKPYSASILNISAMSFGALSNRAIMALNKGAKIGKFAHNTGEGGISLHHLKHGGDLIWQVGTGYFGCRTKDGGFDAELFSENAQKEAVKMIEIKISQGAKPGHGGILPACKNTPEIAAIRGVEPYTDVLSPPSHSAFSNPEGLMHFIKQLRELSGGKPIGFKLCIGKKQEFVDICLAMLQTGIKPDFITIDGGEGGTGAAPVEFSNSIGMPMRDALAFAKDTLDGYDLKKDITLIASGKIVTGFDIARAMALGADTVNCARAMMMSIGCIQALRCNTNNCPVGVATQQQKFSKGRDVEDKAKRAANFHEETLKSFSELISAAGISDLDNITRAHINRRVSMEKILNYSHIFPDVKTGALLVPNNSVE